MNKIEILDITEKPLTKIGEMASICYDTMLKDEEHAARIAKHCINSGHGRNLEMARVTLKVTASARMIRELYTHIGGSPTRLQASTRYITYDNFEYYVPTGLNEEQEKIYRDSMENIQESYKKLKDLGVENDKTGYILPLCMESTVVLDCNVRMLENMFNQRLCYRALNEYRELMQDLKKQLASINGEWKWISDKLFVAKCVKAGYCVENNKKCILFKEK